jgi:hypothetical protein
MVDFQDGIASIGVPTQERPQPFITVDPSIQNTGGGRLLMQVAQENSACKGINRIDSIDANLCQSKEFQSTGIYGVWL